MSKGDSYHYSGTRSHILDVISNLPKNPDDLLSQGWQEYINPKKSGGNSRDFYETDTGLRIRFDKGVPGKNGYRGVDHYHIYNPNTTSGKDRYLDSDGNPVPKNSGPSHIIV